MSNWTRITAAAELPPGSAQEHVAGDRIIGLFNVNGEVFALDGICPHQGGPLGKGTLTGCIVTCPWHGWQFDVKTGVHQATSSLRHTTFATKVEDGDVYVDLPE